MGLNKKAAFFTIITITLLSLFATSYATYGLFQDRSAVNNRITTLNNFVSSVEQDLPRQMYISGYRAIFIFTKDIIDTGSYITDVNASLNEIFFNGTIDGVDYELMDDATFSSMESFLQNNAGKINANINLTDPEIFISQDDPWNIKITFNATLVITDNGGLASWTRNYSTDSYIPITNFNDPIYSVNTASKVLNIVNQTPYSTFVSGGDYTNLSDHFDNSLYMASTSGPNFIMRLEGNLGPSPTGIESLVNPGVLSDNDIPVKYKTLVDYIYFSSSTPAMYSVPAVSDLILDDQDNHLARYNVSGGASLLI